MPFLLAKPFRKQALSWIQLFTALSPLFLSTTLHASTVVNSHQCASLSNKQDTFLLVLRRGENIQKSTLQCLTQAKIDSAAIRGIGAIENPTLAYFDLNTKQYLKKKFDGIYELIALNGDLSLDKGKRMLHLHTVIGTPKYTTFGGHLVDGNIGVTGELVITPLRDRAIRTLDEKTGLDLIHTKRIGVH